MLLVLLAIGFSTTCAVEAKAEKKQEATYSCSLRESVEITYMSQLYVRELTGNNDGVEVERYLQSAGFGKGYAWCAAFVNWTYREHNIITPKSPAWSPSWFPSSRIVPNDSAKTGDVFGIYFQSKRRIAHVGFIHKWPKGKGYCITVEGNTNAAGSREGDGVYCKRRLKRQVYKVANWIDHPPNV